MKKSLFYLTAALLIATTSCSEDNNDNDPKGQESNITLYKTYYFFLPIENKRLTKNVSLIGNDVETSELLHSGMFCTNQKNAFLMCKDSIFF